MADSVLCEVRGGGVFHRLLTMTNIMAPGEASSL